MIQMVFSQVGVRPATKSLLSAAPLTYHESHLRCPQESGSLPSARCHVTRLVGQLSATSAGINKVRLHTVLGHAFGSHFAAVLSRQGVNGERGVRRGGPECKPYVSL